MPMTYEQAVEIARQESSLLNSSQVVISGGYEDAEDFLIGWEYAPDVPNEEMIDGGGNIFVSKETGKVWGADVPVVFDKIHAMKRVKRSLRRRRS